MCQLTPTSKIWECLFPHSFITEFIKCLDFCQSNRWKVNLCNFNLHFSYEWGWAFPVFKNLGSSVNFPEVLDSWFFSYFLVVLYILGRLVQFTAYPLTLFMDFWTIYKFILCNEIYHNFFLYSFWILDSLFGELFLLFHMYCIFIKHIPRYLQLLLL